MCVCDRNGVCKREASQVQCPTLLVHGAKDAMVPAEHPEYFKQHIPNVRWVDTARLTPVRSRSLEVVYAFVRFMCVLDYTEISSSNTYSWSWEFCL